MGKPRILIVDDMQLVHEMLHHLSERYEVDNAYAQEQALEKIQVGNYRGVLTDYSLGKDFPKGGLGIIKAAKRKRIDSILMSIENHKEEALKEGARGFVFKKTLFEKCNNLKRKYARQKR